MFRRSLRSIILTLFCFVLLSISGITVIYLWGGALVTVPLQAAEMTTGKQTFDDPLPPGCIGGTPAGEEPPACCISGFVFVEGRPIADAEVIINTARGDVITVTTAIQAGLEPNPYYTVDLSHLISPTEFITLTARYSGIESTPVKHEVQSGGQRLDLLIYDPDVLAVDGQVQEKYALGKFRIPRDVASDSQGNLYVIDHLSFRVQVFNQSGAPIVRPQWQKTQGTNIDQWAEPVGIAIDKRSDTVYIADIANQRIMRYDSDGQGKGVWDQSKLQARFFGAPADVAVDGNGNVLVLANKIYQYDQDGNYLGQWGDFSKPKQLAIAPSGEIYVTTYGPTPVYRFSTTGEPLPFTPSDSVIFPFGVAVDAANTLYLADLPANGNVGAPRISAMSATGQVLQQWNFPTTDERFINSAFGMTVQGNTLYIADWVKHRLARLNTQGDLLTPWGGADDSAQQLYQPHGVALVRSGPFKDHLFVADTTSIALVITDTLVNRWTYTDTGKEANWTPWKLTVDPQGQLWVMDPGFPRDLTRYTLSADGRQLVRNGGPWQGTIGATSVFSGYVDLAVDSQGYIYMADERNNRLVIYREASATTLTKIAELTNAAGFTPPTLLNPQGIAIDENDPAYPGAVVIYIADTGNNRVAQVTFANQQITPVAAWQALSATTACSKQATTTLSQPYGLVVDPQHKLYVADRGNGRVVKVDGATGQCLAAYGGRGFGNGLFSLPEGIALDSQGRLYVSDWNYSRIQHFVPMVVSAPVATVVHLSSVELQPGDPLAVTGAGQDGDATNQIVAYQWSSDLGLSLTTSLPVFTIPTSAGPTTANTLGAGIHRLQLRVQDNEGEWSAPVTVLVFVERRQPQPPVTPIPTPDPKQTPPPPPASCPAGGVWTFLLYLDADYNDNERLFGAYLQTRTDIESVNHACVQFFIQVDGYKTGAQRYSKRFGEPLQMISDLGEVAMDAPNTLSDFIAEGQRQLPADHYYLAIADHGDGVRGLAWDHTTAADGSEYLTPDEVRQALNNPAVLPIDILHLDACSMALLDVAYQVRHKVKFLIASQYLGWNFFAYADYARYAGNYPQPADLAYQVVQRYGELAKSRKLPATLAALQLARIEPVRNGMDELAARLSAWLHNDNTTQSRHAQLAELRANSQFFDSNGNFTNSPIDTYVDLLGWLLRLRAAALNPELTTLAQKLITELQRSSDDRVIWTTNIQSGQLPARFANGAAITFTDAHGLSIYYPLEGALRLRALQSVANSNAIAPSGKNDAAYTQIYADYLAHKTFTFTRVTHWDEFLRAAYGAPAADAPLAAPLPPAETLSPENDFVYLPMVMR